MPCEETYSARTNEEPQSAAPAALRVFGTASDSIVDGPGLRFSVFVQGCGHACPGCHNPESWAYDGGTVETLDELEQRIVENRLITGVTLSGGEPFDQAPACAELARRLKARNYDIWVYSGYLWDELSARAQGTGEDAAAVRTILESATVLVDGPFVKELKSYELKWRGSSNQRLIDLAGMRKAAACGADWLRAPVKLWESSFTLPERPESW